MIAKSNGSLLPIERSDQETSKDISPKSPMNKNEHSSELRHILEKQTTVMDSTEHITPNHINIAHVNDKKNLAKISTKSSELD